MNLVRMHQCANINCLSQPKESIDDETKKRTTFTRTIYQVDARKICELLRRSEKKSFVELLYLASIDRESKTYVQQEDNLLLANASDLISIAIHWNAWQCTTNNIEELVTIIDPLICLRELFYDVTINPTRLKQLNLLGLICFYGTTIEVFFSYESSTSKWLFCFDGNIIVVKDWNAVQRKCIDFHLQPFLLMYGNSSENSLNITQLLQRTVIEGKIVPTERRLEHAMTKQEQSHSNSLKRELYSLDNLSSFATLNSSMLFLPKPTSAYINEETVAKVMQQQLLKKESLSEMLSSSSSSLVHLRQRCHQKQKFDDVASSGDSSTSSQRDSGLGGGMSDGSPRDSLAENEQIEMDSLVKQTGQLMNDHDLNVLLATIEYHLEQSLKYESASNYSSALESCQRALLLVDQILGLSQQLKTNLAVYARTRKNSLTLRIRSLRKRQIQQEELNLTFKSVEKKTRNTTGSILSSTSRLSRPKKNVKFSDNIALIVPTSNDIHERSSEHLIHSFLRQIHHQQSTSDSDSDTLSSQDSLIGLSECSLCHKRFSKMNQIETYCSNCHFYMQRFRPIDS